SKVILGLASILFFVTFYVYILKTPPLYDFLLSVAGSAKFWFLWLLDWVGVFVSTLWANYLM
ncbi:hypothetical protein, partial [Pseudomonas sp. FW305-BF6]|uniref:hypothetical protein n=2 Tax=unclassified Pseudomonas TaxID=196821 RepID=UPI001C443485